jgi:hypothetical protein
LAAGCACSRSDAGCGGIWPSPESRFTHGVTHTTVRTPSARIRAIIPWASGNWWGLNLQVLYWVAHGLSMTTASSGIAWRRKPS